ncbi:ABC transporter ATP-binding protein [Bacillus manliponensis]|uniref:ABC transporter ATP-binding protein n=1 Tax=Bacillus manliponensis TaxID=574376 RepID=UPI0035178A33
MNHILYFIKQLHSFAGKSLYINLLGMIFISFLEGMGIFLLIPMLSIGGVTNTGDSTLFEAFAFFQNLPLAVSLPLILCIYVLLVVSQSLMQRSITIGNMKIHQGFIRYLRLRVYEEMLCSNWSFFVTKRKTDLINILTTEVGRVSGGVRLSMQLLTSFIFSIVQVGLAFLVSVPITLFVLCSGFALAFFSQKFIKQSRALGSKTSELSKGYLAGVTDQLNGIKDIKANYLEISRLNWIRNLTTKMEQEQHEYIHVKTMSQFVYQVTSSLLIALFIFLSIKMFHAQPAQLLLIIFIFSRLWPRFTTIQSNLEQLAASIPAFQSLIQLQEECGQETELQHVRQYEHAERMPLEQEIECRNVSFRYSLASDTYALKNMNINIPAYSMTAIVGKSGAGKSTLIDLLMGLLQPETGEVLIDGTPLTNENVLSLRRTLSYVSQDPFLFNASIRDNLLMVEPNATEEQMWEALQFAAASEFVKGLSSGINTVIGDRGVRLSGGERQRLVLARAILRKPSILILDEATSALDTENEEKIQVALEQLKGKTTIIVIAHRLSTIRNADQVIVLDKGQIVQAGSFQQLANERRGVFRHLLQSQVGVGS